MKLKLNNQTIDITKRNIKVYRIGNRYSIAQYNLDENEIIFPYNNVELVYYAEIYNGVIVHLNNIDAEVIE